MKYLLSVFGTLTLINTAAVNYLLVNNRSLSAVVEVLTKDSMRPAISSDGESSTLGNLVLLTLNSGLFLLKCSGIVAQIGVVSLVPISVFSCYYFCKNIGSYFCLFKLPGLLTEFSNSQSNYKRISKLLVENADGLVKKILSGFTANKNVRLDAEAANTQIVSSIAELQDRVNVLSNTVAKTKEVSESSAQAILILSSNMSDMLRLTNQ